MDSVPRIGWRPCRRHLGGGPGQATHKVSLRDVGEVDAEVVQLLRVAYEQNA
jgi:hypothetical protein